MRALHRRAGRRKAGLFLVEGPQAVREALARDAGSRGGPAAVGVSVGSPMDAQLADPGSGPAAGEAPAGALSAPGGSADEGEARHRLAGRAGRTARGSRAEPIVAELYLTADAAQRHPDIADHAAARLVPDEVLAAMAETQTPQGMVAVCRLIDVSLAEALAETRGADPAGSDSVVPSPGLVALLARVRDPGNAGTILRAADAAGAGAVVFGTESVDPYNGKAVRSSTGSLFHLPVVTGADPGEAVSAMRRAGFLVVAADIHGTSDLYSFARVRTDQPVAWLFGNEAAGLDADLLDLVDEVVTIPMFGGAESLNLATAAAICLHTTAAGQRGLLG